MKLLAATIQTQTIRESDQILTLLSEELGRISCLVRGGVRSRQRFSGGIDLWDSGYFELEKPKGRGLPLVDSLSSRERWPRLREDLGRFAFAAFSSELILRMTEEDHAEDGTLCRPFLKTLQCLNELGSTEEQAAVTTFFSLLALRELGFDICENPAELPEALAPWFQAQLEQRKPIVPSDSQLLFIGMQRVAAYVESITGTELRSKASAFQCLRRALR